jgi:pyruvate kinase
MLKTKIICTIGPASNGKDIICQLIGAGMNVSRHNVSHGNHDEHQRSISTVRGAAAELGKTVAILLDTQGPGIRVHKFSGGSAILKEGEFIEVVSGNEEVLGSSERFSTTYNRLHLDLRIGSKILIDDGLIEMEVVRINGTTLTCKVLNDGVISDNKSVTLPGVRLHLPALSQTDIEDIKFGVAIGVDMIAASFISNAEDVLTIRKFLQQIGGEDITLISKIENQDGVDNIEEIIQYSDGIMVARGDLGVEIPEEEVPVIQKRIIERCNDNGKPVITATQMLDSMIHFPRPTRAEVSDVTNAIFDGSDCIMLSGETANGNYPVEAVETMARIAAYAEQNINYEKIMEKNAKKTTMPSIPVAISYAAVSTARKIEAAAIIADTVSGNTAKNVSRFRPKSPIIAITPYESVARKLSICWGVYPIVAELYESTDEMIERTEVVCKGSGLVNKGDVVVITASLPVNVVGTTNMIKVHLIS